MTSIKTLLLALVTAMCLAGQGSVPAFAESLAGKVGDKRFGQAIPVGATGGCGKAYKDYVAAAGHSAYASTLISRTVEAFVCGSGLNAKSQKAAEAVALRNCEAGVKNFKMRIIGGCRIFASK